MTTIQLHTRDDWNARPPESVVPLNWSKVTQFVVHISGASRIQSVRSIQNYCMDNKDHSDIDYNELVRGSDLYVGRGSNVGSHTFGQNSISYGICIIGLENDATPDDFNVVRQRYDWACQRAGRVLTKLGHRVALAHLPGHTDCPGDKVQTWIDNGMPFMLESQQLEVSMFFLKLTDLPSNPRPEIWISNGLNTRRMPGGTYHTTMVPLQNAGVPLVQYNDMDELLAGGGPLVDDAGGGGSSIELPKTAKLSFPDGTITYE